MQVPILHYSQTINIILYEYWNHILNVIIKLESYIMCELVENWQNMFAMSLQLYVATKILIYTYNIEIYSYYNI